MLAGLDPRAARPALVPARRPDEGARRAPRPRPPGSPPRARAESQEACFLGGDDYRDFLERHGLAPPTGPRRRRERTPSSATHDGFWRFTPGQRRGLGIAAARAALRARAPTPRTNTVVVGPRASLARTRIAVRGRASTPARRGSRRSSATARPRSRRRVEPTADGFALRLDEPAFGVAPGQAAVLYDGRRRRRRRASSVGRRRRKIAAMRSHRLDRPATSPTSRWRSSCSSSGSGSAWAFLRLGGTFGRLSSFIRGTERELLPVINKVGRTVDRVNASSTSSTSRPTAPSTRSRPSTRRCARSASRSRRPVQKLTGLVERGCARMARPCARAATWRAPSRAGRRPRRGARPTRGRAHAECRIEPIEITLTLPREPRVPPVAHLVARRARAPAQPDDRDARGPPARAGAGRLPRPATSARR